MTRKGFVGVLGAVIAAETPRGPLMAYDLAAKLAAAQEAVRLDVFHVSDSLVTRAALTPQRLEAHPQVRHRVVTDHARIAQTLRRIGAAGIHAASGRADVRWGLVFGSEHGRVFALYLDKFGRHGNADGVPIAAGGTALVDWLAATFAP